MDNGQELVHLLPAGIKDKKGDLKRDAISARIRLAKKSSLEFMKWVQTKFALHQSKKEEMSKGLLRVLSHHYLKMDGGSSTAWYQPAIGLEKLEGGSARETGRFHELQRRANALRCGCHDNTPSVV